MEIGNLISKYDSQNQFEVLINSYKQIENTWKNKIELESKLSENLNNIIVCGMGGSAISGDLLADFLGNEIQIPIIVNRDYTLPEFANDKSIVIISSYSGNTEETLSCFDEAIEKKCKIIAISTSGQVKELAKQNKIPWVMLEKGFQPRYALGTSFFTLIRILQELKLIPSQDKIVKEIIAVWKKSGTEYSNNKNEAIKYAEELIGFIPVIYSSEEFRSVAYRLKCQFNENSKLHAFHNTIPELNHNEIIGWETVLEKQFNAKLLFILDEEYHPQVMRRFEITKDLIQKKGIEIIALKSNEKNVKVRIMDLIYLGDWITFYLAVLRGYDPSEIDYINYLKEHLT